MDDSVSFNEEQHQLIESNSKYYQFGIDYTINKEHSLSASISSDGGTNEMDIDSETDQFSFETLNNRQFNHNYSESRNAYLTNTFTFPKSLVLNVTSLISNGESSGFDTPNSFVRINTRISLSKRFLKNKASASIGIADILGVSNRTESNYVIDNTSFSRRAEIQSPLINFNFSYRFSSGSKINKKSKKSTGVDSSRL